MTINSLPPSPAISEIPSSRSTGGRKQRRNKWNPFKKKRNNVSKEAEDDASLASNSTRSSQTGNAQGAYAPSIVRSITKKKNNIPSKVGVLSTDDYGYGDTTAAPEEDFGYGSAHPDSATNAPDIFGYGDTAPDQDEPVPRRRAARRSSMPVSITSSALSRSKSSLKMAGGQRRDSIKLRGEVEIDLPPSKMGEARQRVSRRTSLSFSETATVKHIESAKDLAGGVDDLWFQKNEMAAIRKKVTALVVKTEHGQARDKGKRYCMRGLERYMDPDTTTFERNQALDSVLNEQYLQQREGVVEENHMANLYKSSVRRSQTEANKRADEDAKEIEAYLSSTRRMMCRRMSM
jgi:hypothetical protein